MSRIIPVILSGGSGTRLWPLSRIARPKQFQALAGAKTLFQETASRVADAASFEPPIVVANADHAELVESQLGEVGIEVSTLILEPVGRNTAPAIALAALTATENDNLLLIMPSDHLIRDDAAFRAAIGTAAPLARSGWLVTFGIRPDRPETGYGYIRRGRELAAGAFEAERFVEKPDSGTAEAYLAEGCYDWNGGIFLFRADRFLEELAQHAPDILASARAAFQGGARDGRRLYPEAEAFAAARGQSIDYAVMEPSGRIAVVPVAMGWSDAGSWDALYDIGKKTGDGNVVAGDVDAKSSRDCLIRSEGPLVIARGVHDLIIVATTDALLILPRGDGQSVREIVEQLDRQDDPRR